MDDLHVLTSKSCYETPQNILYLAEIYSADIIILTKEGNLKSMFMCISFLAY